MFCLRRFVAPCFYVCVGFGLKALSVLKFLFVHL